jgi:hypothetical protein
MKTTKKKTGGGGKAGEKKRRRSSSYQLELRGFPYKNHHEREGGGREGVKGTKTTERSERGHAAPREGDKDGNQAKEKQQNSPLKKSVVGCHLRRI